MINDSAFKLETFQERINYHFKNLDLLRQALTTTQYAKENNTKDYQILETLGTLLLNLS
jgi:dsRNA-specific ribonuclease